MTILIGGIVGKNAVIGTDSQITSGTKPDFTRNGKFLDVGPEAVIAYAGDFALAQPIELFLSESKSLLLVSKKRDVVRMSQSIREHLTTKGFGSFGPRSEETWASFDMLVARNGKLWAIDGDFTVDKVRGFECLGSAEDIARGAMMILWRGKQKSVTTIKKVISTVYKADTNCGGPIVVRQH